MQAFVYGEFSAPVKIQTADSDNGKHLTVTAQPGQTPWISLRHLHQRRPSQEKSEEEIPAWDFEIKANARAC